MKTVFTTAAWMAACLLLITSCKKKQISEPVEEAVPVVVAPPMVNPTNIQAMIKDLETPMETFTVDLSAGASYTCKNGTHIYIRPNSFMYKDHTIATGIITVTIKDILSKKDMILNNAFPVSSGKLLVSGGELYFEASQGGRPLLPNPSEPVYVFVPSKGVPSAPMSLFIASAPSSLSNANLNWIPNNSATLPAASGAGTGMNGYGYDISFVDSIRWFNCDYFYSSPAVKTTCTVTTTGMAHNGNTTVFISMNGTTVLARLATNYSQTSSVFYSYTNSIPVGANYTIGAICYDGTNYFYGSKQVTMFPDMVIDLPALAAASKTQILANLDALE